MHRDQNQFFYKQSITNTLNKYVPMTAGCSKSGITDKNVEIINVKNIKETTQVPVHNVLRWTRTLIVFEKKKLKRMFFRFAINDPPPLFVILNHKKQNIRVQALPSTVYKVS